jgi:hypothetical protein
MRKPALRLLIILVLGGLAACSLPGSMLPVPGNQNAIVENETLSIPQSETAAAAVIVTPSHAETEAAAEQNRATPTSSASPEGPTMTQAPSGGGNGGGRCDLAQAGRPIDITIPDDTRVYPGQYISKTWRLVNAGTCTWSVEYAVVWFSGYDMGLMRSQAFNTRVLPGNSIDVTIEMVAPMTPGTYQSNWKLRNDQGQLFGIGPNGDSPFWVRVVVVPLYTPTVTPPPPTPTPTPAIVASGFSALKLGEGVDLDTGQFNQPESNDISFTLLDETVPHLVPENGARLVYFGSTLPSIEDCRLAPVGDTPIQFDLLQSGTYLCYRTTLGLPGRIYLTNIDFQNNLLNLEFVTWALP